MLVTNFKKPHPRTVLWMKQRKACDNCKHQFVPESEHQSGVRCMQTVSGGLPHWIGLLAYCIDAREPGQPCGPSAALFEAKQCQAVQFSDSMVCAKCNLQWDANDPQPPQCKL